MENKEIKEIITLPQNGHQTISIYETDKKIVTDRIKILNDLAIAIKSSLKDKIDYGTISGCGNKPILFKSGAQKIALLYELVARFTKTKDIQIQANDTQDAYIQVEFKCELVNAYGSTIAEGIGNETSAERKHKGIDPFSIVNTITKMAKKRALVDAILMIGNLSEVFTQDLEDSIVNDNSQKLTKDEKLTLYQTTYSFFKNQKEWSNLDLKESDWKEKVKIHTFSNIFPKLGIKRNNFLEFTKNDADKYLEYLNGIRGI